jgi:cystathionine beta-lyase
MRDLAELQKLHSSKWLRYASDVLPLHVAEMDFEVDPGVRALLVEMVENSDLGYLGPIPEVAEAFVGFAQRHWGWTPDAAQVRMTTDVGVGVVEVIRALSKPGDKVIINSPVYHSFYMWLDELHLTTVDAPLRREADDWKLDLAAIEAQFKSGARFLLLSSPHNPVGRIHTVEELTAIAELSNKYNAYVISDEIHAPLTFAGHKFVPYLSIPAAQRRGIVVTSSSKGFSLAGLKAAIIVTQNQEMFEELNAMPEANHWRASLLGGFAMAKCYADGDKWLAETMAQLDHNRKLVKELLAKYLPAAKYVIPESTYLAWIDISCLGLGDNASEYLIENKKVAFNPGTEFGDQYGAYIRLNFATSPEIIEEGIKRLVS